MERCIALCDVNPRLSAPTHDTTGDQRQREKATLVSRTRYYNLPQVALFRAPKTQSGGCTTFEPLESRKSVSLTPFLELQGPHNGWIFSMVLPPPFESGTMWSAVRDRICVPQLKHLFP